MSKEDLADWDNSCDCCGQTPIIRDMEMCATCVLGEAAAQQELIEGLLVEFKEAGND